MNRVKWFKEHKKLTITSMVVILLAVFGLLLFHHFSIGKEEGTATAATASQAMAEGFASATVVELADISEAKKQADPVEWLVNNSTVAIEETELQRLIDEYKTGAESTANAMEMSYDDFITKNLGYEDDKALEESVKEYYSDFIKRRAVVFAVADKENISISKAYYEENLLTYAARFGYEDTETFTFECEPNSIANEMLYDKTVEWLNG